MGGSICITLCFDIDSSLIGVYDDSIAQVAKWAINDKHMKNASRSIFTFIHQKNKTLPVPISSLRVPVRGKSRYKHIEQTRLWPILLLSDWVRTSFENPYGGFFFLGGHRLHQLDIVKEMLRRFWNKHKVVDSTINPPHPEVTIPFFLHGDEGRGQAKDPVLVLAAQPIIGWTGEESITSKKSFATKLAVFFGVFSVVGSHKSHIKFHLGCQTSH